jgi:glycosyltransferase involved in cell wall biosynthesis
MVSHTFIRREILALEALGVTVIRYALRGPQVLIDEADKSEETKTRHIVHAGIAEVLRCFLMTLFTRPLKLARVIGIAARMGWHSDRGIFRHFAYAIEATVLSIWCARDRIEHLHAHFGTNPAAIAMFASDLSGIPYSFTAHGSEEFEKAPLLSLDSKLSGATFAVCVSSFGKSQLMRWSPPDQWSKIEVVHCGVDKDFLATPGQAPPATPRLVCVGRFVAVKAHLVLVGAVRHLRSLNIDCEVVLVGDGPMRGEIENAIRSAGVERQFIFAGWGTGDRVKTEILNARALILPSFSENMPIVIMEAMALGRPVISTYVAGIPELVNPGETGWLVPASNEIALADAMRECLAISDETITLMGNAAKRHVAECHDTQKEAAKLKELFAQSIAGTKTATYSQRQFK